MDLYDNQQCMECPPGDCVSCGVGRDVWINPGWALSTAWEDQGANRYTGLQSDEDIAARNGSAFDRGPEKHLFRCKLADSCLHQIADFKAELVEMQKEVIDFNVDTKQFLVWNETTPHGPHDLNGTVDSSDWVKSNITDCMCFGEAGPLQEDPRGRQHMRAQQNILRASTSNSNNEVSTRDIVRLCNNSARGTHTGFLCGECAAAEKQKSDDRDIGGHDTMCESCKGHHITDWKMLIKLILGLIVSVIVYNVLARSLIRIYNEKKEMAEAKERKRVQEETERQKQLSAKEAEAQSHIQRDIQQAEKRKKSEDQGRFSTALRIYIGNFQVLSGLPGVLAKRFPALVEKWFEYVDFLSFDLLDGFDFRCQLKGNLYTHFVGRMLLPLLGFGVLYLVQKTEALVRDREQSRDLNNLMFPNQLDETKGSRTKKDPVWTKMAKLIALGKQQMDDDGSSHLAQQTVRASRSHSSSFLSILLGYHIGIWVALLI